MVSDLESGEEEDRTSQLALMVTVMIMGAVSIHRLHTPDLATAIRSAPALGSCRFTYPAHMPFKGTKEFLQQLSSGSRVLFTITSELRMILQNI